MTRFTGALSVALSITMTLALPQARSCDVKQAELEVREVINQAMALRVRQDERFLSFYAGDEYSFPGESWVFRGRDRTSERTRDIQAARRRGETWRMEIRDLHLKAGCEMAWVAGFVHAEQLDVYNNVSHQTDWRLSAVLERRSSGWLIVHQHSSRPITDPREWWKPAQSRQDR